MRTWENENYKVEERGFDADLHCFAVIVEGLEDQIIVPADLEDMKNIIQALDESVDVNGWDDGNGNPIATSVLF